MLRRFFLVLMVSLGLGWGSAVRAEPVPPTDTVERIVLKSRVLGEERPILVRLPAGYRGSPERYPVLYLTDGDGHLRHTTASIAYLAGLGQCPELIVVGIPNTERTRDLTPTERAAPAGGAPTGGAPGSAKPAGGGADRFLRFIETELMPEVERKYRTAPYRILAGHSLGGLFAVHALVSRGELFHAYWAVSPALGWGGQSMVKQAESRFRGGWEGKRSLFLALADEQGGMREAFERLTGLLAQRKPKGLEWHAERRAEEDHASVVPGSYFAALRRLFAGWSMRLDPATGLIPGGVEAAEAHYRRLSERFGYPIAVPEELLNDFGYRLVVRGELPQAEAVFKANMERYPASPNAHDSLGDVYERQGKLELAKKHFSEAVNLGKKSGDPGVATFRANLERVLGKL